MLPVKEKHLEDLLDCHSILLLDLTYWSTSHIRSIVQRDPTHIATKKGNKTLPMELWLDILDEADEDEDEHEYCLVYPIQMSSVQINGEEPEPALVCNIVEQRAHFGRIKNGVELECYETWLDRPLTEYEEEEDDNEEDDYDEDDFETYKVPKNPFTISTTVLPGKSVTIPISDLNFESPFLYRKLGVPDVISWIHHGDCKLCGSRDRHFCAGCGGCRVLNKFDYGDRHGGDCALRMLCPLCIGVEYAQRSFVYDPYDDTDEAKSRSYIKWFSDRKRELGYI
ncbi:unnamed protein product [Fusarium equiseti]|uniref:Uncharacterized protein n=1 Tax=Fusarium equiseti TaxID=61235 RepID=A0A8J2IM96_FUSEQ|nr:unnamed protein product [Fusarium equiseti]